LIEWLGGEPGKDKDNVNRLFSKKSVPLYRVN